MYQDIKKCLENLKDVPVDTVIVDIAGKDSIAAILEQVQLDNTITNILPIVVKAPTEYGNDELFIEAYKNFINVAKSKYSLNIVHEFYIEEPLLWRIINGKYLSITMDKFGFYSPCPGCHLYIHSVRGFIGKKLGIKKIISGERLKHENKIKINQLDISLKKHEELLKYFGIKHLQPLKNTFSDANIFKNLKDAGIKEFYHYNCLYSGNYKNLNGSSTIPLKLESYYDFAIELIKFYFKQLENSTTYNELESAMHDFITKKLS